LDEDFTDSAQPVVPSKEAPVVPRVLIEVPSVVPATGKAGSVPAVEESANSWTAHPLEYASPDEGERLPPLVRDVFAGVEAVVVRVVVGNGLPAHVLASAMMVGALEAHECVSGVTPVSRRFPLAKELALLTITAENIVAAAMPGTRTNHMVPSPMVAIKRRGWRGLVQNEVDLVEGLRGTIDDQVSMVSRTLDGEQQHWRRTRTHPDQWRSGWVRIELVNYLVNY
jgi:hypothetical protein